MSKTKQTIIKETENVDDSPTVKIAVMNNDIKHINETLGRMESKFDAALNNFVTVDQLAEVATQVTKLVSLTTKLKATDDIQQGAINANRHFTTILLTIVGFIIAGVTTYVGIHK